MSEGPQNERRFDPARVDSRVSALEAGLETLTRHMEGLTVALGETSTEARRSSQQLHADLRDSHDRLARDIAAQSRTNYPLVAAILGGLGLAVTVLVGFVALSMGALQHELDRLDAEATEARGQAAKSLALHAATQARIISLERQAFGL